jgi:hypothetical protein
VQPTLFTWIICTSRSWTKKQYAWLKASFGVRGCE